MKKIIYKLSTVLVAMLLFATACENEPILFESNGVVGFGSSSLDITEDGDGGSVNLYLGADNGTPATSVTLEIVTEGFASPAIEGEDFTISGKDVNVDVGTAPVTITPIDNENFEGNKSFMLKIVSNSQGYDIAAEDSVMVTIIDNEHPLKQWIGSYDVAAASYGDPGNWDEAWTVTTSAVEGDVTQLALTGIAGSEEPIYATFDTEAMTISIAPGQTLGDAYGYGPVEVYKGETDLTIPDTDVPLEGTISEDGTINVDFWANYVSSGDYGAFVWDVFNTTWTKTAK